MPCQHSRHFIPVDSGAGGPVSPGHRLDLIHVRECRVRGHGGPAKHGEVYEQWVHKSEESFWLERKISQQPHPDQLSKNLRLEGCSAGSACMVAYNCSSREDTRWKVEVREEGLDWWKVEAKLEGWDCWKVEVLEACPPGKGKVEAKEGDPICAAGKVKVLEVGSLPPWMGKVDGGSRFLSQVSGLDRVRQGTCNKPN